MGPLTLLALFACEGEPDVATPDAVGLSADEAVRLVTRASLDLRGVRPSVEDLRAARAEPHTAGDIAAGYLDDPAFGERYAELMAGVWLTPVGEADHDVATYPVDNELQMLESLGMEPMKVLARVAAEGLPYTELVTGDWTVVNENLATFFPTDYPTGGSGWQVARYTDGRPAAGVLSTNGFWWRYDTTLANANRGRANAISRVFTCHDYLAIQIEGDRDLNLLDEEAIADALRSDPACVACHADIDPIASYLWGFYNHFNFSPSEQAHYHAEREPLWEEYTGVPPSYRGVPGRSLEDLGRQLAEDPRFVECAVERTMEQLLSRPARLEDTEALTAYREDFLAGGLTVRALVTSVLADPAYAGAAGAGERAAGTRLLRANAIVRAVEVLTGYRFESGALDVFGTDLYGFRSLAGGLGPAWDSDAVVEPNATSVLVQERFAQAAGWYVAQNDLADPGSARLLVGIDGTERPDSHRDEMGTVVQDLYLRILSRDLPADDAEIDRALALWSAVHEATDDPTDAWGALVAGLLRDPDFVLY